MDVGYIIYKNNQFPVRISYYALKMFQATHSKNIEDIGNDMKLYEDLLFFALESGARYTDTNMELTREDMEDVLDHCFFDFMQIVPQFFAKKKTEKSLPELQGGS